ncbi:putative phosphotransacetylase [Symbiobacterium terraclitae]|uniref:Phosphate propanoyltransferase n=1 Tax=Symbiobacterium terraclitae TaxID=557451 RepID=A0ABS4JSV7_9FIRM|nr:phosphate propanoyltransferase [Symbiobacterium terraclitae]MBP2018626.1 putative phosphotransacetylase [Symbiobacterium terraclitae]
MSEARTVIINVSARHVHLSPAHVEALFGPGYQLTVKKELMQPGQFAAEETVAVIGPKGSFPKVRVLGPARGASQVEISATDARTLGIPAVVRLSGNIAGTPGVILEGPKGRVELTEGVIVAARHIHMTPADAAKYGVTDRQVVRVKTNGGRPLTFDDVIVRVRDDMALEMHIDTDEANAAGIKDGDIGEILL